MLTTKSKISCVGCLIATLVLMSLAGDLFGQQGPDDKPINALATKQQMILDRIARLEEHMFRLREKLAEVEPENAEKLGEALSRTGELEVKERIERLVAARHH